MQRLIKPFLLASILLTTSACVVHHSSSSSSSGKTFERYYYSDWETEIGYAQVVRDGDTLYVSGIPAGGKDMSEAMQKAYERIADILAKFEVTPDQIMKEVIFTKNMEATKDAIEVRKSFFSEGAYPAATWVQIDRLYDEGLLIEVDVIAKLTKPN